MKNAEKTNEEHVYVQDVFWIFKYWSNQKTEGQVEGKNCAIGMWITCVQFAVIRITT